MKKTLALLVVSTALTAAISFPAWSTMQCPTDGALRPAVLVEGREAMPRVLASTDDDSDDDPRRRDGTRRGHDDGRDDVARVARIDAAVEDVRDCANKVAYGEGGRLPPVGLADSTVIATVRARQRGLDALCRLRGHAGQSRAVGVGGLFSQDQAATASAEGR